MSKVTILFKKAVREEIKEACEKRGITLPETFDTEGQVFEDVIDVFFDDGFVSVEVPHRTDEDKTTTYSYPREDVARVKTDD